MRDLWQLRWYGSPVRGPGDLTGVSRPMSFTEAENARATLDVAQPWLYVQILPYKDPRPSRASTRDLAKQLGMPRADMMDLLTT